MTDGGYSFIGTNAEKLVHWVGKNSCPSFRRCKSQLLLLGLLRFIHAPHDLRYFIHVIGNLHEIFTEIELRLSDDSIKGFSDINVSLSDLNELVGHLYLNIDDIAELLGDRALLIDDGIDWERSHPMRGSYKYYYAYAMVINVHESQVLEQQNDYRALQAYILLCHILLVEKYSGFQDYVLRSPLRKYLGKSTASGINVSRAVRIYSKKVNDPSESLDLSDFSVLAESIQEVGNLELDAKKSLRSYINLATRRRSIGGHSKGRGGGYSRKFYGWSDGYVRYSSGQTHEEIELDDKKVVIVTPSEGGEEQEQEMIGLGLDPSENYGGEDLILINNNNPNAGRLITRSQVRHIIMANQLFSNQVAQATVHELAILMEECGKKIRCDSTSKVRRELISMVMIMLWTGSSLDAVKSKFRWLSGDRRYGGEILGYRFDEVVGAGEWVITPHTAYVKKRPSKKQKSFCRQKDDYLTLPDRFRIGQYIVWSFSGEELADKNNRLFKRSLPVYRKELSRFIASINRDNRLNEFKISRYLFYKIASEGFGDIADAILITGRYHPLGQTLLHYTSPDKTRLRNIYDLAISDSISRIYHEGYKGSIPKIDPINVQASNSVGSHLCPTMAAVEQLVTKLKSVLSTLPRSSCNESEIEYHNWYTLYTVLMIGYSTGYRAIVDPFPVDADIDTETGLAVISDKDGADYYNSRIVWVPELVQSQISNYMAHREKILSSVSSRFPSSVNDTSPGSIPRLFFLGEGFEPTGIRPSTLTPLLEDWLPLPLNVNRRFLRTKLRARNCPSEVVDAFMGHWARGQEPWGEYSSLSVFEITEILKGYITYILFDLKFDLIKSRYT
ncbi:MAG: hypothetical protein RPT25_13905 [Cycloclasticus sp.]|jgi:hypothetical protein